MFINFVESFFQMKCEEGGLLPHVLSKMIVTWLGLQSRYPSSVRGKTLGIIPDAMFSLMQSLGIISEVFGKDFSQLFILFLFRFKVQQKQVGRNLTI